MTTSARRGLSLLVLLPLMASQYALGEEGYEIGPQDTLTLSVYEWRSDTAEPFEWKALTGDFRVEASGQISLPLLGSIAVAGSTPEEVSNIIAQRLQQAVGLVNPPTASVQIKDFRPIYVVGSVDQPGEYAFRPGLSVLQAIGLAGGMRRAADSLFARFERDAINARGDMRVIRSSIDALIAKRARLLAELGRKGTITFSSKLTERKAEPHVARLIEEEKLIFLARKRNIDANVKASQQLRQLLTDQIASMKAQIELREKQVASAREELAKVTSLVDRGLGTADRQLDLERTVADYESGRLDLERSIIAAQVAIADSVRSVIDLYGHLREEAALELRQTDTEIQELSKRFETASQLVREAEITGPLSLTETYKAQEVTGPDLSILREIDGKIEESAANENTLVKPGDTVRVTVSLPGIDSVESLAPAETFDLSFDLDAPLASMDPADEDAWPGAGEGPSIDDDGGGRSRFSGPETADPRNPSQTSERASGPAAGAARYMATDELAGRSERRLVRNVPLATTARAAGSAEDGEDNRGAAASTSIEAPESDAMDTHREGATDEFGSAEETTEEVSPAVAGGAPSNPGENDSAKTLVVNASALNIRDEPQLSADVIAVYDRGTKVTVLESREGWARVETADGTRGWMSMDHLSPAADIRSAPAAATSP